MTQLICSQSSAAFASLSQLVGPPLHPQGERKKAVLYSFWRSSCSWRLRIALALKGIEYDYVAVDIGPRREQNKEGYAALNPMKQVPTLEIDGVVLSESVAVLEYLEEVYPDPPLLPKDPKDRALIRKLVETVNSGTQPLQNNVILEQVAQLAGEGARNPWAQNVITRGLTAFEEVLKKTGGRFCFGDFVTMADVMLVPQLYNARRFEVSLDKFPKMLAVEANLVGLEAFQKADPKRQPDTPPVFRE